MNENKKVVTRIAPSPTGLFHIGTARTALINYLFAKQQKGAFLIRIEDTDRERSKDEFERDILEGFKWLALDYDDLQRQSERTSLYAQKIQELIASDSAYISKEPAKDDPSKEVQVVRLRNPGKQITFSDLIRGEVTFDTTELGDFVIARSVTEALYHLAVVIDDDAMGVTHVIRGEDHISNTPRHILIQEALGIERPTYAHLPLILDTDRSKLSKRKNAVSVTEYKKKGYLPGALLNYMALLGWNPGTEKEIFTMEELIDTFSIENVQKGGAIFDIEKLTWIQKEHKKLLPREDVVRELTEALHEHPKIAEVISHSNKAMDDILERFALTFELQQALREGEYDFYEKEPILEAEKLPFKKDTAPEQVPDRLSVLVELLENIETDTFLYENIKDAVWGYADSEGKGGVLWPMRYALSGKEKSPDPFLLAEALGKDVTLRRLKNAIRVYNEK